MLVIAFLDYTTGKELSVWALYLVPIALASWWGGFRQGIQIAVGSCGLILLAGLLGGNPYTSVGYFLLQVFNRFTSFFLVAWLASHLFRKQMLESTLNAYEEYLDYLLVSPKPSQGGGVSGKHAGSANRHRKQEA
jgi:hypothetical protein